MTYEKAQTGNADLSVNKSVAGLIAWRMGNVIRERQGKVGEGADGRPYRKGMSRKDAEAWIGQRPASVILPLFDQSGMLADMLVKDLSELDETRRDNVLSRLTKRYGAATDVEALAVLVETWHDYVDGVVNAVESDESDESDDESDEG